MKAIRKRLTYANVMSSIAVFLVLGGATALAAGQLGKNTVGSKQLKKNAVTAAKLKKNAVTAAKIQNASVDGSKVKDGSLTGSDINVGTLGTVPSATTANSANSANALNGRTPVSFFMGDGVREVAAVGPFTISAHCVIDNGGEDEVWFTLTTTEANSAMDDNNGDEFDEFNPGDVAELAKEESPTGDENIEAAEEPGLIAVSPNGTAIVFHNEAFGLNIANHARQCYLAGVLEKIS